MNLIIRLIVVSVLAILSGACRSDSVPVPIINTEASQPPQATVVSVQPTGAATAEVVVKLISSIKPADWQLTAQSATGTVLRLDAGPTQSLSPFSLASFTLNGLTAGQTCRLRLRFLYNQKDTLTQERTYTHVTYNPWKKLAHLPFNAGLFTGSIRDFSADRLGNIMRVTRYVDADTWHSAYYSYGSNQWFQTNPPGLPPRRGLVEYTLYFNKTDEAYFYGLGYQTDDLYPGKYQYIRDMYAILNGYGSYVFPAYAGEDGEIAFFTTTEWAFFLTQNGSPAMRGIYAQFQQETRAPLPEKPGTLVTFSIGETGYVVNQLPGQPPRLFAYNSETDVWTRKADFPGVQRLRGIAFSVKGKGYFGLGTGVNQQGLRDIWQYDPATDQWQYSTDYPGQGNRYLITFSAANRAFLGWGYESQIMAGSAGTRLLGCTDFWEFRP